MVEHALAVQPQPMESTEGQASRETEHLETMPEPEGGAAASSDVLEPPSSFYHSSS